MNHFFVYNHLLKIPIEQESLALRAALLLGRIGISLSDTYATFARSIREKEKASKHVKLKMMMEDYLAAGDTKMVNILSDLKNGMLLNKVKMPVQGFRDLNFLNRPMLDAAFEVYTKFLIKNFNKAGFLEIVEGLRKYTEVYLGFATNSQKGEDLSDHGNSISKSLLEAKYDDIPCFHILQHSFLEHPLGANVTTEPFFLLPDLLNLKTEEFPLIRKQTQVQRDSFLQALASGEGIIEAAQTLNQALKYSPALSQYYLDQHQFFLQLSLGWVAPTVIWDYFYDQGMIPPDSWEIMQVKRGLTPEMWSKPVPFLVMKELEGGV